MDGNHGYSQANDFDSSHLVTQRRKKKKKEKRAKNSRNKVIISKATQLDSIALSHCVGSTCRHCIIRENRWWWRGNTVILRGVQAGKKPKKRTFSGFSAVLFQSPTARFAPPLLSLSLFSSSFILLSFTFPREALSSAVVWSSTLRFFFLILFSGRARSRSCSPLCLLFCFLFFFFLFNLPSSYHTTPPLGLLRKKSRQNG